MDQKKKKSILSISKVRKEGEATIKCTIYNSLTKF